MASTVPPAWWMDPPGLQYLFTARQFVPHPPLIRRASPCPMEAEAGRSTPEVAAAPPNPCGAPTSPPHVCCAEPWASNGEAKVPVWSACVHLFVSSLAVVMWFFYITFFFSLGPASPPPRPQYSEMMCAGFTAGFVFECLLEVQGSFPRWREELVCFGFACG